MRALILVLLCGSAVVAAADREAVALHPITFNLDVAPLLQKHCHFLPSSGSELRRCRC